MATLEDPATKKRRHELEDLEIQERRVALEERQKRLRQSDLELPLQLMAQCNTLVASMGGWDPRDQIRHKAMVSNYVDMVYKNSVGGVLSYSKEKRARANKSRQGSLTPSVSSSGFTPAYNAESD